MDPFATLGLPATFDLDATEIERRYRDLQRTLHPDRFVSSPAAERRVALSRAVEVNEAYRTLRDDLSRAEALLVLRGRVVPAREEAADPAFLMEIMERREALSEARTTRDLDAARRLAAATRAEQDAGRARLSELFGRGAELAEIAGVLAKMRYYRRFLDEAEVIEEEALGAPPA